MTREEKSAAIHDYCENRCREIGCDDTCPLHIVGENEYCFTLDGFLPCNIDRNYSIIFGNDEVDRKNDEIKFAKVEHEEAEASNAVEHPSHYCNGGIECIEAIKASMTADGFLDYCKGNVLKYIWRWRDKGGVQDLEKARVYLGWMIEECEHG